MAVFRLRTRTSAALLAIIATAAAACSSGGGRNASTTTTTSATGAARPGSCTPARPAPVTTAPQTFRFGNRDRTYLLALPRGYDGRRTTPLLFDFHGFLGHKEAQEVNTGLGAKGTARGFIVVTPDSLGVQWNAFSSPTEADDFGFVHALVADLERRLCVDPDRVYAAGHSNGSAFAAFLVCKPPFDFVAVAMVSATTPSVCPRGITPAVLAIAGTADPQVPYGGGTVRGSSIPIPAATAVVAGDATKYGCDPTPERTQPATGVDQVRYTHCRGGSEVVLDTVVGGTHAWPGGPAAAHDPGDSTAGLSFPATDRILDFFSRHRHTTSP